MIRFNNDYNHGAFESILNGLAATNTASYAGYGEDEWCARAEDDIKKLISRDDALIKFIPGDDEDVASAKLVYGRDFARIRSLSMFADTVGMLISNQIKNL